jgi:glycosyltransferase involved in cell wall biosynthesis
MTERGRISLVYPQATEEFAQRLELLLFDDEIRKLWLDWASQYVKLFDYANIVDQYEVVYKKAIKKKQSQ